MPPFLVNLAANYGIMAANFMKMAANQVLSCAAKVSFIRNRGNFHLQTSNFPSVERLRKANGRCRKISVTGLI